ncbi:MAG: hypothetical protein CM1200mP10_18550 [Candidatus Neomarinimicrobiota bacterium]|nr:MAG: hypothetical protein CM1200mP10_18550 [Candidatus Neomarinimicrobiota bacterium]
MKCQKLKVDRFLGVPLFPLLQIFNYFLGIRKKAESIAEKLLDEGIIVRQLNAFGWPKNIRYQLAGT